MAKIQKRYRLLMTGLASLLPTLLTIYLFYVFLIWIHERIGVHFNRIFGIPEEGWQVFVGSAIAFLLLLFVGWFTGFIVATYMGRVIFLRLDHAFRRIPVIRVVYPAVKQVCDFFLQETAIPFNRVVCIEYPRRGIHTIAFITGHGMTDLLDENGEPLMTLFVPNSPAPLTGFTIFLPRSEITPLDLTVDEAVKLIVSAGVVIPPRKAAGINGPPPTSALGEGDKPPQKET